STEPPARVANSWPKTGASCSTLSGQWPPWVEQLGPFARETCAGSVRLITARLQGGAVQRALVGARRGLACGDLIGVALAEFVEQDRAGEPAHGAGVLLELRAGVREVEVSHGELADPVDGPERRVVRALHRQFARVVGQRRAAGVEYRVVLAATQPQA